MGIRRTLLIDGDILLYRFAYANQFVVDWGGGQTSEIINEEEAKVEADKFLKVLVQKTNAADRFILVFSHLLNFRYDVLETYKHNRVGLEKPKLHGVLKEFLKAKYQWKEIEWLEGDDVLGVLLTKYPKKYIAASIDKDLMQVPGLHYNWNHDQLVEIDKEEADFNFYLQALMGDPTDGYSGCPKIGKKRGYWLLKEGGPDYWKTIVEAYARAGLPEEFALQQARMARIIRAEDYDFKEKKPILWTPQQIKPVPTVHSGTVPKTS